MRYERPRIPGERGTPLNERVLEQGCSSPGEPLAYTSVHAERLARGQGVRLQAEVWHTASRRETLGAEANVSPVHVEAYGFVQAWSPSMN